MPIGKYGKYRVDKDIIFDNFRYSFLYNWEVDVKGLVIGNLPDFDKTIKEVKGMF